MTTYVLDQVTPLGDGKYRISNAEDTQAVITNDPNKRFQITVTKNRDGTITEEGRSYGGSGDPPRRH